ncbi:hypothetical protein TI05_03815, partial [Achromatium sp. WMS3]
MDYTFDKKRRKQDIDSQNTLIQAFTLAAAAAITNHAFADKSAKFQLATKPYQEPELQDPLPPEEVNTDAALPKNVTASEAATELPSETDDAELLVENTPQDVSETVITTDIGPLLAANEPTNSDQVLNGNEANIQHVESVLDGTPNATATDVTETSATATNATETTVTETGVTQTTTTQTSTTVASAEGGISNLVLIGGGVLAAAAIGVAIGGGGGGGSKSSSSSPNNAPTDINLSNLTVDENAAGSVIGDLTTTDADAGDTHTYTVNDDRFEIVAGQLKLKDDQTLDHETAATVDVTITAKDSGNLTTAETFTITVNDVIDPTGEPDTIDRSTATDPLTINALAGDDTITTGSGKDIVRPGQGKDTVNTGGGDDIVVVVGTNTAGDYTQEDINAPNGDPSLNVSSVIPTVAELNENAISEMVDGEIIDGGNGTNKLLVYGNVDVTKATISNIDAIYINSSLTITTQQLQTVTEVIGDGTSSALTVQSSDGTRQTVDLSSIKVSNLNTINIGANVTIIADQSDLEKVETISVQDDTSIIQAASNTTNPETTTLDLTKITNLDPEITIQDQAGNPDATQGGINHKPTAIALSNTSIVENASGEVIGKLSTTDPDTNDTHSYTVDDTKFEIVADQLKLKEGQALDHEAGVTNVTITATDAAGLSFSQTFTIDVTNVNEAPTAITLDTTTIDENAVGAVIGSLSATDQDVIDTHSYTVVDDNRFEIVSGQLKLKTDLALDYETKSTVTVTIKVEDAGGLSKNQELTINVNNVPEAPTAISLEPATVDENADGVVIGNLTTTDPEGGVHTYTVNDTGFEIFEDNKLKLQDGQSLNYEDTATVAVTVTSEDSDGLKIEQALTIQINDVPEAPTAINLNPATDTVDENATGVVIGSLSVTDQDKGDTHNYTVDDTRFEVTSGHLKLKDTQALDYENDKDTDTVTVKVTAEDKDNLTTTQEFAIKVNNINEAPTDITLDPAKVDENAAGAEIGTLKTTDQDAADTHTYTVNDERFEIVDNKLKLKDGQALDYETASEVAVTVTSKDPGDLTTEKTFTIQVNDANEAPIFDFTNLTISENAPGDIIRNLTVTDPDVGDTHTYKVSDERFEVVEGNKFKLKDDQKLDYETEPTVAITIIATDNGTPAQSTPQNFTIQVINVDEVPTGITLSNTNVNENAAGSSVGNLSVDPDSGDTHTYTVSGDNRFEIVSRNQLKLKDGVALNYEAASEIGIDITVQDAGGQTATQTFTIQVNDIDESLNGIELSNKEVDENVAGAVIGSLSMDVGPDGTYTYAVDDERFEVSTANELKLKDGQTLDYETETSVDLIVTDVNNPTTQATFTITIKDIKETTTIAGTDAEDTISHATGLDNFIIDAQGGNDTITTGSGNDIVRPGPGTDTVNTGSGNDIVVIVGTTTADQYAQIDIDAPSGNTSLNVSNVLTLAELNGNAISEAEVGETIDGGDGTDTLVLYGDTDLTKITLAGISKLQINSNVIISAQQLADLNLTDISGNGKSNIKIVGDTDQSVDLSAINFSNIQSLEFASTITGIINQAIADALQSILGTGSIQATSGSANLDLSNTGVVDTISVLDQSGTVDTTQGGANRFPTAITLSSDFVVENITGAIVGDLTVTDPDTDDTHTFSVNDTRFHVAGNQLKLKDTASLDHEVDPTLTVTVTARDSGGLTKSQDFTIQVDNVNEAPNNITLSNRTIDENAKGVVIGNLSVTDPDTDDFHTVSIDDARFEIYSDPDQGLQLKLKHGLALDYETESYVDLTVTATDHSGLSKSQIFTIQIQDEEGDVNETPTAITLSNVTVTENVTGATIGTLTVTDPNTDDTHTFSVDDDRFQIDGTELKLKNGTALDYEASPAIDITVNATDSGGLTKTQIFTLNVEDQNEAPTAIALSDVTINEGIAGTVVGTLSTTDPDPADTHTYSIYNAAGNLDNRFEVDGFNRLKLANEVSLDYETQDTITVKVTATDNGVGNLTYDQVFTIQIDDLNEAPTAIALSSNTAAENTDGVVIGNLTTTDPDAGDTHTYSVNDLRFEAVDGQLKLKAGQTLDYEDQATVNLVITATDSTGLAVDQNFAIEVNDTNDAPIAIGLSNRSIAENAQGAVIGNIVTTDLDADDTHTYSVDDTRFEIVDNPDDDPDQGPQLKLKDGISLDYETAITTNINVTATDDGGLAKSQLFTIDVYDVNENPTDLTLSNITIAENAVGAVIGNVSITDPNDTATYTYTVDDLRFEIVDGQLKLKADQTLDRETEATVNITITGTDTDGLVKDETFTLYVNNVNETPYAIELSSRTVDENAVGVVIGNLSITDPDADDDHIYSVDDGRFEVVDDPDQGPQLKLKHGVALDYEAGSTLAVAITATDSSGLTTTQSITLDVQDQNDAPTAIALSNVTINEATAGAVVGTLATTDQDTADTHTYTIDDARFEVDGYNRLRLKATETLDYETEDTVTVKVTATDSGTGNLTTDQIFTIQVNDRNEAPTAIELSNNNVNENADGVTIGNLTTTDPDANDTHTYRVNDTRFEVVDGQLKLKSGVTLDWEAEPTVNITVTTVDGANLTFAQNFTIEVNDTNDAPIAIGLSNRSVTENAAGAIIGNVFTNDLDADDTHTYSIDDTRFEVVDNPDDDPDQGPQLKLKHGIALDYEAGSTLDITITATDDGGLAKSQLFTIDVYDVNENPTDLTLSNITIAENDVGAVIGNVSITDPNDTATYTYTVDDLRFEVVDGQLKLKADQTLDRETEATVNITLTGTDTDGLVKDETFTLYVNNVNETPTSIELSGTHTVDENAASVVIGTLSTTDPDADDTFTYNIDNVSTCPEDLNCFFEIDDSNQLKLKNGKALDYETAASIDITITATDSGGLSKTQILTLDVQDQNDAPTDLVLANTTVDEVTAGAVVGTLSITDQDATDTHTYAVDDTRFEVDGYNRLKLKATENLDYETEDTVTVKVTATDSGTGNLTADQIFTIQVNDRNEAPIAIALTNDMVDENVDGAIIGYLSNIDPDTDDTYVCGTGCYKVNDIRFEIVGVNGSCESGCQLKLKSGVTLDYEVEPTVNVMITAADAGRLSFTQSLTIEVNDTNDAPIAIDLDNRSVEENDLGAIIGNLITTDPDGTDTHSYSVDDARFEVVDSQLKLKHGNQLNYDDATTVDVTVTATDSGGLTFDKVFTIDVQDLPAAIEGTNGPDTITGTHGIEIVRAGLGADNIDTKGGNDIIVLVGKTEGLVTYTQDDIDNPKNAAGESLWDVFDLDSLGGINLHSVLALETLNNREITEGESAGIGDNIDGGEGTDYLLVYGQVDFDPIHAINVEVFTVFPENVTFNQAPTAITLDNREVTENALADVVGTLTVDDPNTDDA